MTALSRRHLFGLLAGAAVAPLVPVEAVEVSDVYVGTTYGVLAVPADTTEWTVYSAWVGGTTHLYGEIVVG